MKLPQYINELHTRGTFVGPVETFVTWASKILAVSPPPFFFAYPDHGLSHIENVLESMEQLIPTEVRQSKIIGPVDAAIMICAALLHDIAMQIHDDGFLKLISGDTDHRPIPWFAKALATTSNEYQWPRQWVQFENECRRFGDEQLQGIFGDQIPHGNFWELPSSPNSWTDAHRLLIGEFLRRHHPRLAHEIAIYGFPGSPGSPSLASLCPAIADIAGVVARSHGVSLRLASDYIAETFPGNLRPMGGLPVFLMALLRVADYLQITPDRAPGILLELKNPQSPRSVGEWRKHAAVADLSFAHKDPQAVYVHLTNNHTLRTHLQCRELLEGLQREMDTSAAVLSEVYGRIVEPPLNLLRLSKSRVRHNGFEPVLLEALSFVPRLTRFEASPKLLALLVRPLYGDSLEVAVRELIQNSVDAVQERVKFCEKYDFTLPKTRFRCPQDDIDIEVQIDCRPTELRLTIRDSGIGMTEEAVCSYFLHAGASFRDSPAWQASFIDPTGQAIVHRAGNFGIGVFAAFLVADSISVSTRHVSEQSGRGMEFIAKRDSELIEIRKIPLSFGTEIVLRLTPRSANHFAKATALDWYTADFPRIAISRILPDEKCEPIPQRYASPTPPCEIPPYPWSRVTSADFPTIFWTYAECPRITCNGLRIAAIESGSDFQDADYSWSKKLGPFPFPRPNVAIYDAKCALPLTLQRDRIVGRSLSCEDDIAKDIWLDYISFVLAKAPRWSLCAAESVAASYDISYEAFSESKCPIQFGWCSTRIGASVIGLLPQIKYDIVIVSGSAGESRCNVSIEKHLPFHYLAIPRFFQISKSSFSQYPYGNMPKYLEELLSLALGQQRSMVLRKFNGTRLLFAFPKTRLNFGWFEQWRGIRPLLRPVASANFADIFCVETGDLSELTSVDGIVSEMIQACNAAHHTYPFILQASVANNDEADVDHEGTQLDQEFKRILGTFVIPFASDERDSLIFQAAKNEQLRIHLLSRRCLKHP